ncbi:hypothetical protein BDW59DRAFT_171686 [Aspergillus cavernicola]|uniref:DUF3074 domain-containing protein n=1 Tax=Aspergillus cavernicola TaxID=176166 RepID=A0ABR4IGK1_9EURO
MSALQEALKYLTATPWDQIPTNESDLQAYLSDLRTKARLIIDSVPEPPPPSSETSNNPSTTIKPSPTRLNTTNELTLTHQKEWSKPIVKPVSTRDNPFGIAVYKLPGADGQGHWFGRRSVHAGLPFGVWEEKLSGEIAETLRKNQERVREGFPPDQAVRGIGAEKSVEEVIVRDHANGDNDNDNGGEGKVVGRLNVYHVSASFPRPTTSRDFVTMIITWEGDNNGDTGNVEEEARVGRSWMMVSRPCVHPDVPEVQEYIRGQYESVEMIREILVERDGSGSGTRSGSGSGSGSGSNDTDGERGDAEDNPIEWTMVTRSDPGGTIPRWMVEKGTPKSICSDAAKFLDWACQGPDPATKEHKRLRSSTSKSETSRPATAEDESETSSESDFSEYDQEEHHGLIASFGHLLTAGIERYAPQAVLDYIPQHSRQPSTYDVPTRDRREIHDDTPYQPAKNEDDVKDEKDETMSQASLNSELPTEPTTPAEINLDLSAAEVLQRNKKGKLSSHERHLAKLAQQKRSLEAQIELVRTDIQSLGLRPSEDSVNKEKAGALLSTDEKRNTNSNSNSNSGSPSSSIRKLDPDGRNSSSSNLRSRAETTRSENPEMNKVASALFREESKLLRQLAKIERHQVKEATKIEAQQRKEAEKQDKARSRNESDLLRREIEHLRKECEKLKSERKKWLGLIGSLQAENTKLARQVGVGEVR